MTDVEPVVTDFAATGRTGRRNALPDILGSASGAGSSDLPEKLAELSVSGKPQRHPWASMGTWQWSHQSRGELRRSVTIG
uniref:cAMP-dependent protein kinase inhibitor beta n=1 Tax=Paramormyrops kingsleyae TaxID=1676925 RepID=A0A3B3R9R3_9TELE